MRIDIFQTSVFRAKCKKIQCAEPECTTSEHEYSSSESTKQFTSAVKFRKKSNEKRRNMTLRLDIKSVSYFF